MTKDDFKVGQTVYILQVLNLRKTDPIEKRISEVKILAVGRKYITVDFHRQMKFDATKDFREVTQYSPNFKLYLHKEQIFQELRRVAMERDVCSAFAWSSGIARKMSTEDLQTVFDIVSKYRKDDE